MVNNALLTVTIIIVCAAIAVGVDAAVLEDTDCIKCHTKEPLTIKQNGGLHKTAVGCLDCHEEHPPLGVETIPECSKCHIGTPHYSLDK